jgi:hypothetical protein
VVPAPQGLPHPRPRLPHSGGQNRPRRSETGDARHGRGQGAPGRRHRRRGAGRPATRPDRSRHRSVPGGAPGRGRHAGPVRRDVRPALGAAGPLARRVAARVSNSSRTSINVPPAPAASRPCPAGGHTIPPPLPPRTGPASAGRCAPKPQEPAPPQIGSTGDPETARKLPRTSSAVSLATPPSASSTLPPVGARSKPDRSPVTCGGHVVCYRQSAPPRLEAGP